jgi:hypothetical protein
MTILLLLILTCSLCPTNFHAMQDNGHFYRASNIFYEPRFDRDWLSTLEISAGSGSTQTAKNCKGNSVPLFDIDGLHTLAVDNQCIPISIGGTFEIIEANFFYAQNFLKGFFVDMHIPLRTFRFSNLCFRNASCTELPINTLRQAGLPIPNHATKSTGSGDFTLHAGYTHSYQENKKLDFIDTTVRAGILIPTSPRIDATNIFELPHGYNGHWGFPLAGDIAFGAFEWLTVAAHGAIMFFVERKPLFEVGALVKADHVVRGFSCTLGYAYTQQLSTNAKARNHSLCCHSTVENGFIFHTLHIVLELDCILEEYAVGPRIALLYNHSLGGKNIFDTSTLGGRFGIDVAWDF